MPRRFDMLIVGGGPGGYVAALRARQLGLTVCLIEKERIGGVCLNRGCIPTKAMLADVEGIHWMHRSIRAGVIESIPPIVFPRMIERREQVVQTLVSGLEKLLKQSGVEIVIGTGKLREPGVVHVTSEDSFTANAVVLATGARSWVPPIPGFHLPGVLTSRGILGLQTVPQDLVIVGGGIIGQEFASIFSGLGSRVTILEMLDRVLPGVDEELVRRYVNLVRGRGITNEAGAAILEIVRNGDKLRLVYERKGKEKTVDADVVLMATGRRPAFSEAGGEDLGIETESGAVKVDGQLQTSLEGLYAIGDVTARNMLAHVASFHGEIVAERVAGIDRKVNDDVVPCCVFTLPQFAWVGPTEEEARTRGTSVRSSTFSLAASGKALAAGEPQGWVKLVETPSDGRLIGAHLLGHNVSELISELTLAIRSGMTAADIADTIHSHPTLSEAVREAALGLLGGAIHAPARVKTTEGA